MDEEERMDKSAGICAAAAKANSNRMSYTCCQEDIHDKHWDKVYSYTD